MIKQYTKDDEIYEAIFIENRNTFVQLKQAFGDMVTYKKLCSFGEENCVEHFQYKNQFGQWQYFSVGDYICRKKNTTTLYTWSKSSFEHKFTELT